MPEYSNDTTALEAKESADNASHVPATSGATLLPRPVASLVSLLTQSTSLSLRLGSFFGGFALNGARVTTLTGLELSRAVIEGILTRAGRDVAIRSRGEHGKAEAESLLERSLATLHGTVTSASFFAAATFHFSSATLSSVSHLSQTLLSTLDAILGSTESSRAIAAIITLIRKEFGRPELGNGANQIGVGDLLVGSVGFAMLQRWGRKNTERHMHENGGGETIWDVVILDNGMRADVIGTHQNEYAGTPDDMRNESKRAASFISPGKGEETFDAVERRSSIIDFVEAPHLSLPPERQHQISDENIRLYIMNQLPQGCRASIASELVTARTITVDIFDDDTADIIAPPGTMIVEERFHHDQDYSHSGMQRLPKHTIVFRTAFNKSQSADVIPRRKSDAATTLAESKPTDDDSMIMAEPHHVSDKTFNVEEARNEKPGAPQGRKYNRPLPVQHLESNNDFHQSEPMPSADPDIETRLTGSVSQKRNRESSTSSLHSGLETPKSTFGKGSLTKIAQKVKPASTEKSESSKKHTLKRPSVRSIVSSSGASLSQLNKAPKAPTAENKSVPEGPSTRPNSKVKRSEAPPLLNPRISSPVTNKVLPRLPLQNSSEYRASPSPTARHVHPRDAQPGRGSRTDSFSVRERNQESFVAQTDSYSLRSVNMRPGSPSATRTHVRSSSSMSITRSEAEETVSVNGDWRPSSSGMHQMSKSFSPSIYSLAAAGSETSLILAHRPRKSAYEDMATIQALNRNGSVPGIFPEKHLVENIRRFCRFSSASYGSNALKVMGIPNTTKTLRYEESYNHEHSAFSDHAGLPPSTILLSSYVDPAGGSNAAGETDTGFPLVHYLCIDHESKAVVLTLRGTWGFEDVLTDMTCDYDDLEWQGRSWKVHKGMHASARRLLEGGGGKVMITIKAALEEFTDYGVILCGHSLGGGVAALLATMISEPNSEASGPSFVTASHQPAARPMLLAVNYDHRPQPQRTYWSLPPGRPIHVYAYGPPSVMSPFLRRATRGLVTTIVNGQDVVPSLSLGILHDLHAVALAFKSDASGAKSHVRQRVWEALRQSVINKFYVDQTPIFVHAGDGIGEDAWAWKALKLLREEMRAPKLVPPGEVFVVDTMRVLQRDAFTSDPSGDGYPRLGRPATRVQLRFIRDVEAWFGELRFGSGMLSDHNPVRYEASLAALARGVLDD